MGFWVGIKRALNSTLGTSGFKPLNTMIDESKQSILSEIDGQRTLAASDSVIKVLSSSRVTVSNSTYKSFGSFTPKKSGSIRVLARVVGSTASGNTFRFWIKEEGIEIGTASFSINTGNTYNVSIDIPILENTSYEVNCTASDSAKVEAVELGASIVDTSLVEVV